MYRLKKNVADFVVVDGPFARRTYRAGKVYAEIPPQEKHKFEDVNPRAAALADKAAAARVAAGIARTPVPEKPTRRNKKQAAR